MTNENTLQQMIKQHEANMPPEIMTLIKSFDWKKEVRTIVNQNQLMIDVGADLEESIYLILLGVVTAEDFYNRLVETHEIPEDKAQKIIQEAETQIFSPMYKKMMELDTDSDTALTNKTSTKPIISPNVPIRDQMLAEIEKEPEPMIKINMNPEIKKEIPEVNEISLDNDGIVKPFSLGGNDVVNSSGSQTKSGMTQSFGMTQPSEMAQPEEVKPAATPLTQPTVSEKPKGYAVDPYREPIE